MLKTKSEVSALVDFLDWLEFVNKKNGKNGVILICHESYKFNPHLLIKSLQKYVLPYYFKLFGIILLVNESEFFFNLLQI